MDHGGGGRRRRSSSRLRDRLARMFRPGTLLRSTCNMTTSSTPLPAAGTSTTTITRPSPSSTCSSSRALLGRDRDSSFLASSRRDYIFGRTESFSTVIDRLHCRGEPIVSCFSINAPPPTHMLEEKKSPHDHHRLMMETSFKMKPLSNDPSYGFSSSDDVVFTSDANDENLVGGHGGANNSKKLAGRTFFTSSRSFSSDSSEFYASTKSKKKSSNKSSSPAAPPPNKPPSAGSGRRRRTRKREEQRRRAASSCYTCGVRDGSAAEEQQLIRSNGFAVVKRSRDPYADFRSSMVEMIVGRQLLGAPELERLLRSYLSLNAPLHHPVILQAFCDIWVVLHGGA